MIGVEIDERPVKEALRSLHRDQVPYALAQAINKTGVQGQEKVRDRMAREFTQRRKTWMDRSIKIGRGDFATKQKLRAIVKVETPGAKDRSDVIAKFEDGGTKRPKDGRRLAVPDEVKRTGKGVISKTQRPKAFDFELIGTGPDGTQVFRGKKKTFMVKRPDGTGGIYQRTGRKTGKRGRRRADQGRRMVSDLFSRRTRDANVRTLYRFTPDAKIDTRLHFTETIEGVVKARFSRNFDEAFAKAIEGGRFRTDQLGRKFATKEARRQGRADVRR